MTNLTAIDPRSCKYCQGRFTPKPGGHNALYCSERCKLKCKRKPIREIRQAARNRSYEAIKSDPVRYAVFLAAGRKHQKAVRDWLAAYKLRHGCCDCGFNAHSAALQLDHEGPKGSEIADCRSSIDRLKLEIEIGQCVVRCANCHSIRTWKQKQLSTD